MPLHISQVSRVSMSGSRYGMTDKQTESFRGWLIEISMSPGTKWLHQGCCIGADEQATLLADGMGFRIYGHPPLNKDYFSEAAFRYSECVDPEYSYSGRNQRMVLRSELLIATPKSMTRKGGTWNAIGHAQKMFKPYVIIKPDGNLIECPRIQHYT